MYIREAVRFPELAKVQPNPQSERGPVRETDGNIFAFTAQPKGYEMPPFTS